MALIVRRFKDSYESTVEHCQRAISSASDKYGMVTGFIHLAQGVKTAAQNHRFISTVVDPVQRGIDYTVQQLTLNLFSWLKSTEHYQKAQIHVAVHFFPTNTKLISVIQVTVHIASRLQSITQQTLSNDLTGVSHFVTLLTGDIQDLGAGASQALAIPNQFRSFVEESKERVLFNFYGSLQKPEDLTHLNAFGALLKPVQWRCANNLISKEDAIELIGGCSKKILKVTDNVETMIRIEGFKILSTKALEQGTFIVASQGVKYIVSDWTGYVLACTIYTAKNTSAQMMYYLMAIEMANDDDEWLPFSTFITLYKTLKYGLWVYLIHRELKTWNQRREAAPQKARESIHSIPSKLTTWTNKQLETGISKITELSSSTNEIARSFFRQFTNYFHPREEVAAQGNESWLNSIKRRCTTYFS